MIWKTLAAVAAAIVLVIAINFIGNAVFEASTPTDLPVERTTADTQLEETPNISKAGVGQSDQGVAQVYDDPTTEVRPSPQTSLGTDSEADDQPVTQQSTVIPTEGATQFQEQAQEQAKEGEQARPEPAAAPPAAAGGVAGDPEAGKAAARVCAACHSFDQGGANKVGPNLYGVFGADIAHKEGFNYSDALKNAEGDWTADKLDAYLANPKQAIPGNKMGYAGMKDEAKRQDLIAYMASLK